MKRVRFAYESFIYVSCILWWRYEWFILEFSFVSFFLFVDEEKSREEETKVFDISVLLNFLLFAVVHRVLV